jgi:hypothetical protein
MACLRPACTHTGVPRRADDGDVAIVQLRVPQPRRLFVVADRGDEQTSHYLSNR